MKIRMLLPVLLLLFVTGCKKEIATAPELMENARGSGGGILYGSMRDIDGNVYKTVKIGTQTWMAENLKVIRYRNGASIQNIQDNTSWGNARTGAWCYYDNDAAYNNIYGKMYNGYATQDVRGLAPKGWHIPTLTEWQTLKTYLGDNNDAGQLKATILWGPQNVGATNSTGFSALPGGVRGSYGQCINVGSYGYWHTSTLWTGDPGNSIDPIWFVSMSHELGGVSRDVTSQMIGYSVRCVKDVK